MAHELIMQSYSSGGAMSATPIGSEEECPQPLPRRSVHDQIILPSRGNFRDNQPVGSRRGKWVSRNARELASRRRMIPIMAERIMFVQLKTGFGADQGPAWISVVRFSRSWRTAYWHDRTLRRTPGLVDGNFVDVETHEEFWLSGPHRDRADTRFSCVRPRVDDGAREAYQAFLGGAPLPGREHG